MFPFDLFRSFLPLHNPIGFGAADFIELALVLALAVCAIVWTRAIQTHLTRLANSTLWSMLTLAVLPIALRLLLMIHYPAPIPAVSDEFSYVLLGDTIRHFRFANPSPSLPQFFESNFIFQQPTHSSIYPMGQGIVLAIGWLVFGHPWAGVALSIGALAALCYWMLRAWTTPGWALLGGVLAAIQFGPLNQWMNSYWGGAVSACAGCLVFGSLPRLRESSRVRDAVLLGAGLGLQSLTRPFEFIVLVLSVILYGSIRTLLRRAPIVALAFLPAVVLMLFQNHAVTGSWTTLPYQFARYQYGLPGTFTFQPNPIPHRTLNPQQQLAYETHSSNHGDGHETVNSYLVRLGSRVRFYRFFFLPPLYLILPLFLTKLREYCYAWVAITLLIFSLGTNFYPYFFTHYIAALTCLFVLISVAGLERLSRVHVRNRPVGNTAALVIVFLCLTHFAFWYGMNLFGTSPVGRAVRAYEPWDAINLPDPDGRATIFKELLSHPGKHLVFVRYSPRQMELEWVHNAADMDNARIVWAHDLGDENEKLKRLYPDRNAWLLDPDFRPPRLTPMQAQP